ncbi:MAG: hypothetical protein DMG30_18305 [Acidobacteria bacterium]|nr:MAG: hypothetical protein DMG30_18305 [Acidobacteriota bacterium]
MTSGDLKFGFQAGAGVAIVNYRPFTTRPSAPQFLDAVKDTVAGFVIPGDIEDLEALSLGTIVTLTGTGTLKFSATADLLAAVNPLASASLPVPLPTVALKGGGSITIGADVEITGEYQIRVLKYGEQQVRLAYYRKSREAFSVKVKASAGVSANVGESDILGKLMSAISSDAKADAQEFERAGLPPDQIKGIEDTVKGSIERTVGIAVTAELSRSQEHTAAFVYEIDLNTLSATSRAAIHSALDGDLSALTLDPDSPLSGVRATRDLFTNVRQRKYALDINLLGIVNYGWISKLVLAGKTMYEPTTGQLIISDSATASRIGLTLLNIGVADAEKLRHVMAENFLITVAYRGAGNAGLQSTLTSSHSFFAMNQHTPPETVRDELDASVALGLMDQNDERKIVTSAPEFGGTLFYAATHYDNTLSTELFLSADQARPVDFEGRGPTRIQSSVPRRTGPSCGRDCRGL